jgi:hypothetical protein
MAKKTNSVSFYGSVLVLSHLHINNYSKQEIASSWLSKNELRKIKAECAQIIGKMVFGKCENKEDGTEFLCSRGLERLTPNGARLRQRNKYVASQAVLEEQDRQWHQKEVFDAESLAQVYSVHTDHCSRASMRSALRDERFVREQEQLPCKEEKRYSAFPKLSAPRPLKGSTGAMVSSRTQASSTMLRCSGTRNAAA